MKDECGDDSRCNQAMQLNQDLRFGWRMMKRSRLVNIAAVVSLALGIGATTAILSFTDAVQWRKIAVPEPEQMLEVYREAKARPEGLMQGTSGSTFTDSGLQVANFFSKAAFESMRERSAGKFEVAAHLNAEPVSAGFGGR